jgi:sulfide dehydrogenase subunit beta
MDDCSSQHTSSGKTGALPADVDLLTMTSKTRQPRNEQEHLKSKRRSARRAGTDTVGKRALERPSGNALLEIVAREDFSENTYLLEVLHPMLAQAAQPGQFVMVMSHARGERIPLTIADYDRSRGTVTLVIQAVGKTTQAMWHTCQVGTRLLSMAGPMGHPTRISDSRKVVCVGGGLGVAPLFPQVRAYHQKGAHVIAIVGFRSQPLIFWQEKFRRHCDQLLICTDDGSAGLKGMVTEGLARALQEHPDVEEVVAIGPPVMMRACAEVTRPNRVKTVVSLNPIMVDGTGMCGGCRVSVAGKMKFACVDGPEFDGHEVDFDELMKRQRRFVEEEKRARDWWREECQLTRGGAAGQPPGRGEAPTK